MALPRMATPRISRTGLLIMRHGRVRLLAGALLAGAFLTGLSATPASAQFFAPFYYFGARPLELSPRDVLDVVREEGYRRAGNLQQRGDYYYVDAVDGDSYRVRLTVDAFHGRILGGRVLGRDTIASRPRQLQALRRDAGAVPPAPRPIVPEQRTIAPKTQPEAVQGIPPEIKRQDVTRPPAPEKPVATRPEAPEVTPPPARKVTPTPPATKEKPPAATRQKPAPPTAKAPPAAIGSGTPANPRKIEITPPAALDDVQPRSSAPPVPQVPPSTLE
jgi:hypothetical protein